MEILETISQMSKQFVCWVTGDGRLSRRAQFCPLFIADCIHPSGIDLRRPDEVLRLLPESRAIAGSTRLYGALENESLGLGLSETDLNWSDSSQTYKNVWV